MAPSQTLYLKNLNEKTKIPELKKALYLLFSQFGNVLDLRAVKNDHLRGQAWVVMGDVGSAVRALREMDGFSFYGKDMRVHFAKHDSDVVVRARGDEPPKRERRDKRKRLPSTAQLKAQKRQQQAEAAAATTAQQPQQPMGIGGAAPAGAPPAALPQPGMAPFPFPFGPGFPVPLLPNRVLFVENLPAGITLPALSALFAPHPGFVECRLVPVREGVAFVEFEDEARATHVLALMQGFKLSEGHEMRITYAKR